jgi:hypothetical protein
LKPVALESSDVVVQLAFSMFGISGEKGLFHTNHVHIPNTARHFLRYKPKSKAELQKANLPSCNPTPAALIFALLSLYFFPGVFPVLANGRSGVRGWLQAGCIRCDGQEVEFPQMVGGDGDELDSWKSCPG